MTDSEEYHLPQHVAIIMDGNNRFAKKNQMQKGDGHREGKNVLDPIVEHCVKTGVRAFLRFIGDRSRLPSHLVALMEDAEQQTAHHDAMTLTIAVSYGGMWDIANAAKQVAQAVSRGEIDADQINVDLFEKYVSLNDLPAVDLLIRTGGDFRISNFLLWQAAYAELYFTDTLWPEFTVEEFDHALNVFSGRERRFGKTSEQIQQEKIEKL